jgi:hypothetical protein
MRRFALIALAALAAACGDDPPTTPSTPTTPTFAATLLPANENPPVTGPEAAGSGTMSFTLEVTRDSAQTITAATFTFNVALTGFPTGTPINLAHIHTGGPTTNGGVVVNLLLTAGQVVLNGPTQFSRTIQQPSTSLAVVQDILNNPSAYYFNVHSSNFPGGVARGQLARTQ